MTAMYTIRRGGSYDRFLMMLEAFLERNCETHCLSLTPIPITHSYFHNHVMSFPLKTESMFIVKLMVIFLFPLWSLWIVWKEKIDLIIAFGSLYAFLLGFSKWLLERPMVTFIRGNYSFSLRMQNSSVASLFLNKIIEYYGLLFSDKIITNNSAARDEILKNLGKKKIDVQVLYNNIPPMSIHEPENIFQTRDKYGIPRDAKVLVITGILNRGKNIETLIECLPNIKLQNVYLLIVGDGSTEADFRYKDFLQKLTRKLALEKNVLFTGWLEKEEMWKVFLASDLFVLPSLREGMPNALLEALGIGLPCFGSNIAGVKDILEYDELIFNPMDENMLANKIKLFFCDSETFARIKRLCQERSQVFIFDWREEMFNMIKVFDV